MVWIEGGQFTMGSNHHYPEERPERPAAVEGFWIDRNPVTNREFARFVAETGYRTFAEQAPDPADYPGALPEMLVPSSLVFQPPARPVDPRGPVSQWWSFQSGADWRHPMGPDSSLDEIAEHPVVHVALVDVEAYLDWAGLSLPNEAEWEFAARGGSEGTEFAWGSELVPGGVHQANTWQGAFPYANLREDGWLRTSPVGTYPANGYGLNDMIGNVWEWTADWWRDSPGAAPVRSCCSTARAKAMQDSVDPNDPTRIPRRVLKGGSHLCAPNYCQRYRPAARHAQPVDTSTSHVGFRAIARI
ncbi:formylglycine-generating enzyme required for sulfatase activity [Novosphingobium sp. PhB57]|uniref:formylglycine-generating enzyme family protein n=1 Tax=Novosphingobium sp. PhB57 TaxID=2485107 RepID=UPI001048E426|nr:formylglycine-generating enzyme family protein [Novosphingobium sp. PhB57]TCU61914.1 formylglycine-generating enzyme required for sulfatase activity [Novosphingobium sp. PhB57]